MSRFQTTRWSLLLAAGTATAEGSTALAELCRIYRPAVLAYLRQSGHGADESEDLAQSFFLRFLEKRLHAAADPQRGRFRVFLRTAVANYVSNLAAAERSQRRGGGSRHVALDEEHGLAGDPLESTDTAAPEQAFEREFALTLLQRALDGLARECDQAGKGAQFEALREFIAEAPDASDYGELAERLGMRPNTVAVAVHRLRQRLRERVRLELADLVAGPEQLEDELAALREALSLAHGTRR